MSKAEELPKLAEDCPEFVFLELNPRRRARGAEAARMQVDTDGDWLWMSRYQIQMNIGMFGPHPELVKALKEYK